RNYTKLLQQTEQAQLDPSLDAFATRHAVDSHACHGRSLARGSHTHEVTLVRTPPRPTHHYSVAFGNHVVDCVSQIREGQSERIVELLETDWPAWCSRRHLVADELRPDKFADYAKVPLGEYLVIEPADKRLVLLD